MRTRYSLWAALLGFLAPGLGHLYVARARRFIFPAAAFLLIFALLAALEALSTFIGMVIFILLFIALAIFGVLDAAIIAHRINAFEPKWYCRWYVYLGWAAFLTAIFNTVPQFRESLLGYSSFRLQANSMAPTIEAGEIILVDTRTTDEPPTVGSVVVVRSPSNARMYVRRISDLSVPGKASFKSDNVLGAETDLSLQNISLSNLFGRVTYIFYSENKDRIGRAIY